MSAYVPRFVPQLDGSRYAGSNCTMASAAVALDRATLGRRVTTGAAVRALTSDTVGGTNQRQAAEALDRGWNVELDVVLGISSTSALTRLDAGQGMMLAGGERATHGTKWQASETFMDNHQWFVNDRRKNSQAAGGHERLVFDPLGDGRRSGIADFAPHGLWLPENLGLDFARRLNVSATPDSTYVPLGYGHFYAGFTDDTEPHLVLRFGARAINPLVIRTIRVPAGTKANCRGGPFLSYRPFDYYANGSHFTPFQVTTMGQRLDGNSTWYGNQTGTRWLHATAF